MLTTPWNWDFRGCLLPCSQDRERAGPWEQGTKIPPMVTRGSSESSSVPNENEPMTYRLLVRMFAKWTTRGSCIFSLAASEKNPSTASRSRTYDPSPDCSFRCSTVDLKETCRGRVIKLKSDKSCPTWSNSHNFKCRLIQEIKIWCAEKSELVFPNFWRLNLFLILVLFLLF